MAKRNALAELTDRFDTFIALIPCFVEPADEKMLDCMKRIVAELAKVEDVTDVHNLKVIKRPNVWQSVDAISKCRAIALEGAAK